MTKYDEVYQEQVDAHIAATEAYVEESTEALDVEDLYAELAAANLQRPNRAVRRQQVRTLPRAARAHIFGRWRGSWATR